MSAPLTLHFIRHGEVYNPTKVLYGRLPGFFLSTNGRQQAAAASEALADRPLNAIYSSPMERAQETAQIIREPHSEHLHLQTDERINEVHVSYQGTPLEELERIAFELYTRSEPPYETIPQIRARVIDFVMDMRKRHAGEEIVAVTHGDIVVLMFLYAMGQTEDSVARGKLEEFGLPERYPATASISTLNFRTDAVDEKPDYEYLRPY